MEHIAGWSFLLPLLPISPVPPLCLWLLFSPPLLPSSPFCFLTTILSESVADSFLFYIFCVVGWWCGGGREGEGEGG